MSNNSSNQRLPYNQPQRSQPQHRQQPQPQPQPQQHQHSASQQMGGYMMHQQQPNWVAGARQAQQYDQQQQQSMYQQQVYQQHIQQQHQPTHYGAAAAGGGMMPQQHQAMVGGGHPYMHQQQAAPQLMQVLQPRPGRLPADRPIMKLSVGLIETYKEINKVRVKGHFRDELLAFYFPLSTCTWFVSP
jgi:hypothetical protein